MFRDREEELQRLEQELLAQEEEEEYDEELEEYDDEPGELEQTTVLPKLSRDYKAFNSDTLDTDLDRFSDEVREGRRGKVLPWLFVAITAVLLVLLWLYLKQGGYLG